MATVFQVIEEFPPELQMPVKHLYEVLKEVVADLASA
jgi:hypothetical protein